jgi:arginase
LVPLLGINDVNDSANKGHGDPFQGKAWPPTAIHVSITRGLEEQALPEPLVIIGAPSSAGSYAPGQERAPAAIRAAGLHDRLRERGVRVEDRGDGPGFRWCVDRASPRAMNAGVATQVARATADSVTAAMAQRAPVLVLGGDCTVELGTVAGALTQSTDVGLIYVDLDVDLNTPESTTDGALDWMGVAHMLGVQGSVPALAGVGPRSPLLRPDQILFFGHDNVTKPERAIIDEFRMVEFPLARVATDPEGTARAVVEQWARRFELLLIHLDVDVLDYLDMPLAENTRRNVGLRFTELMAALRVLLTAPNWAALTVCEVNPDHGEADGSTMRTFVDALSDALAGSPRLR